MIRITPDGSLVTRPCSYVAVFSALGQKPRAGEPEYWRRLREDGYATLETANKFIRANLSVKRRKDYKRGERPLLRNLHLTGKAVVCVYGHYLYLEGETYHSFFDNEDDEVVSVWELE